MEKSTEILLLSIEDLSYAMEINENSEESLNKKVGI